MRLITPDGGFWSAQLDGARVHATWGKGRKSQSKTTEFKSPDAAEAGLDGLLTKVKKLGYQPEVPPRLVTALTKSPDDDSPLVAFADELSQREDPRGELAVLVAQRKLEPMTKFLLANAPFLFGQAEPFVHSGHVDELGWAPGFLRSAKLESAGDEPVASVTSKLLASPVGCLLRTVRFAETDDELGEALGVLLEHEHVELIDTVELASPCTDVDLAFSLPNLRHLGFVGAAEEPAHLPFTQLVALSWTEAPLDDDLVDVLLKKKWPRLERLQLGQPEYDPDRPEFEPGALVKLAAELKAPLQHLSFVNVTLDGDAIDALVGSAHFKKLRSLDLGGCSLTDSGEESLREHESRFAKLRFHAPLDQYGDDVVDGDDFGQAVWPGLDTRR